jgi:hypothetical protein
MEQTTLLGHIPQNDRANGPLDGTKLSSLMCVGGVRHIYASFSESFWHQEVLICFDDVPHMKYSVLGLEPTIWHILLVAAELGFVEEHEAASCFIYFVMGRSDLATKSLKALSRTPLISV